VNWHRLPNISPISPNSPDKVFTPNSAENAHSSKIQRNPQWPNLSGIEEILGHFLERNGNQFFFPNSMTNFLIVCDFENTPDLAIG
jgi:hypothetical protein